MRLTVILVPAFVACFAVTAASAQTLSFRCKNDLVNIGASKASALQKCGEPVAKDAFCKPTDANNANAVVDTDAKTATKRTTVVVNNTCETVDEWTYNPGTGQFMTTLRFESGKLVAITYGDRVK